MKRSFKYKKIDLGSLDVKIPILEFGESNDNNSLAITCCVHGNETTSLFVIEKLVNALRDINMKGKIKIITVSNPIASFFNNRTSPKDMKDMNRSAPGDENGSTTDVICREIIKEILECNYYIDLHEWGIPALLQCILIDNDDESVKEKSNEIMKIFNPDIVVKLNKIYRSSLYGYINIEKRMPGIAIELPNMSCTNDAMEDRIVDSLMRVLNYLNIIQENKKYSLKPCDKKEPFNIREVERYVSKKQGLFFPLNELGATVFENEKIGCLVDLDMEGREVLSNNFKKGLIMHLSTKKFVNPGDLIYTIAEDKQDEEIIEK